MNNDPLTSLLPSSSVPSPAAASSARAASSHRFWWHVTQAVWALLREIDWARLPDKEAEQLDTVLDLLEGVVHLTRTERPRRTRTPHTDSAATHASSRAADEPAGSSADAQHEKRRR